NENIVETNPMFVKTFDLSWEEILDGSHWKRNYYKSDGSIFTKDELPRFIAHRERKAVSNVEVGFKKVNGEFVWVRVNAIPLPYKDFYTVVTAIDITELKKQENKLKKFSRAVEQSAASVIMTDPNGIIEYVNPKFLQTTGYTLEETIGQNPKFLKSGELSQDDYKVLWDTILSGKEWNGEFHNKKKNGEFFWELASISPIINDNQEIIGFLAVKEDITQRKITNELLKTSVQEKEILLSEIHHRVKNNLQIVSSIINMGTSVITDKQVLKFLNDTSLRVQAMSTLHNKLYSSENFSRINMYDYIETIVRQIKKIHTLQEKIQIHLNIQDIEMNIESAMPCGLIVNEIVTNSFKHAFHENQLGEIGIDFILENEKCKMRIYDNGKGFPNEIQWNSASTLGLRMIQMLTRQLKADVIVDNSKGTCYIITFAPVLKNKKHEIKKSLIFE
ncbi:MAG: PAS domain S-box protein, partial [Leptospiraceae bacterium]|nr:PAS domain S-box protein [Leptospiraceae bacterium]